MATTAKIDAPGAFQVIARTATDCTYSAIRRNGAVVASVVTRESKQHHLIAILDQCSAGDIVDVFPDGEVFTQPLPRTWWPWDQ